MASWGLGVIVRCSVCVNVPNRDLMTRRVPCLDRIPMRMATPVAVMTDLKTRWANAALQALTSLISLGLLRMRHGSFDRLIIYKARVLLSGTTVPLQWAILVPLFSVLCSVRLNVSEALLMARRVLILKLLCACMARLSLLRWVIRLSTRLKKGIFALTADALSLLILSLIRILSLPAACVM